MGHLVRIAVLCVLLACSACLPGEEPPTGFELGRQAFSSGQFMDAEKHFEEYLRSTPAGEYRWEAWNRLLNIAFNVRNDPARGANLLEAMILEYGNNSKWSLDLMIQLSDVYASTNKWERAVDALQRGLNLVELTPVQISDLQSRIGRIYLDRQEYDLARDAFMSCIRMSDDPAIVSRCRYDLAQVFGYMKVTDRARDQLEQLVDMDGISEEQHALAVFYLAELHEDNGDLEKARELFTSIIPTYPNPKVVEIRLRNLK